MTGPYRQRDHAAARRAGLIWLTSHVLVASGDEPLGDRELVRPARDGMLVEADGGVGALHPVPGTGAAAKGVHLVPGEVATPRAHRVTRRTVPSAAQQSEPPVLHLIQVENARHPDHQREHAGQQPPLQSPILILETRPCRRQPVQGRRQEEECSRVVRGGKKNSADGVGRATPGCGNPSDATATAGEFSDAPAAARSAASRPYFFMKW